MRLGFLILAMTLMASAACPTSAPDRAIAALTLPALDRTATHTDAARSTCLLPFEFSAVRLRAEPRNRSGV